MRKLVSRNRRDSAIAGKMRPFAPPASHQRSAPACILERKHPSMFINQSGGVNDTLFKSYLTEIKHLFCFNPCDVTRVVLVSRKRLNRLYHGSINTLNRGRRRLIFIRQLFNGMNRQHMPTWHGSNPRFDRLPLSNEFKSLNLNIQNRHELTIFNKVKRGCGVPPCIFKAGLLLELSGNVLIYQDAKITVRWQSKRGALNRVEASHRL